MQRQILAASRGDELDKVATVQMKQSVRIYHNSFSTRHLAELWQLCNNYEVGFILYS